MSTYYVPKYQDLHIGYKLERFSDKTKQFEPHTLTSENWDFMRRCYLVNKNQNKYFRKERK